MKTKYGNISRVFMTEQPAIYNRETRMAYMDFQPDTQVQTTTNSTDASSTKTKAKAADGQDTIEGFSGFVIQTDGIMDYAHIKSQLVEAAYPQKEEHALAFNTIDALIKKVDGQELTADEETDLATYKDFAEYRSLCANCAKAILNSLFN
nr:MAG TPA: hypothetical protein [Caudoviricetes sp.]